MLEKRDLGKGVNSVKEEKTGSRRGKSFSGCGFRNNLKEIAPMVPARWKTVA